MRRKEKENWELKDISKYESEKETEKKNRRKREKRRKRRVYGMKTE